MHENIRLGLRLWSTSEMTEPSLVDLTAKATRERVPHTAELVVELVAIHPLAIDGISLNDRQLNILLRDV